MISKKAKALTLVGEYDIELMNKQELRMYVKALKEEHELMRKARNLFQKDKSELLGFLKTNQDNNFDRERKNIQKSLEMQEVMTANEQKSIHEDESNKVMAVGNSKTIRLASYVQLKTVEFFNKEKEEVLIKDIAERDKEIKHLKYTLDFMLTHSKENACTKRFESSITLKNNSENFVHEYNEKFQRILNEFSENKIAKLQAILGDTSTLEYNLLRNALEKMITYFTDIYWKNSQTAEKLSIVLRDLKKELNTTTLKLRDFVNENDELRTILNILCSPTCSQLYKVPSFSSKKLKKVEELTHENYLLSVKLEMANKEFFDLKNSFVKALRKVYQATDFRDLLLELKLLSQQEESSDSS